MSLDPILAWRAGAVALASLVGWSCSSRASPRPAEPSTNSAAYAVNEAYVNGDWPAAAHGYEAMVNQTPADGHAWYRLGKARSMLSDYQGAVAALSRALASGYSPRVSLRDLSFAEARLGHTDRSLQALRRLVDGGYSDPERLEAEPALTSVRSDSRFAAMVARARRNKHSGVTEVGWSPDGRHLVIGVDRFGQSSVCIIDADGTHLHTVATDSNTATMPLWSPDGRHIAYVAGAPGVRRIYVVDVDGSHRRPLSQGPGNDHYPQWSPDGRSIVFNSDRTGRRQIYRVDADGGNETALTDARAIAIGLRGATMVARSCSSQNAPATGASTSWIETATISGSSGSALHPCCRTTVGRSSSTKPMTATTSKSTRRRPTVAQRST